MGCPHCGHFGGSEAVLANLRPTLHARCCYTLHSYLKLLFRLIQRCSSLAGNLSSTSLSRQCSCSRGL